MKRLLLVVVAGSALSVGGAAAAPAPDTNITPATVAKKCKRGFRHAVIGGRHECLRRGARCRRRFDRQYHRYRFHCHGGRLTTSRRQQEPGPLPTRAVRFTSGTAHVEITGDKQETFDAPIHRGLSTYDPEDREFELIWRNEQDRNLVMSLTFARSGRLTDAFVAIGAPGSSIDDPEYYPDAFHTQCRVTVGTVRPTRLEGTFTCDDLQRVDGTKTIDANGTFSAST